MNILEVCYTVILYIEALGVEEDLLSYLVHDLLLWVLNSQLLWLLLLDILAILCVNGCMDYELILIPIDDDMIHVKF
jgi:hypothetical protein